MFVGVLWYALLQKCLSANIIICTISLAISYVSHLYFALKLNDCQVLSVASVVDPQP